MPDMATKSLNRVLSGEEYDFVGGVPIFDEHDEFDADGNLLRRFGKAELEAICNQCNAREGNSGDLSPFGPGHTVSYIKNPDGSMVRAPERIQPEIWGYWRNYRVEPYGPSGRLAIVADQYVKKTVERQDEETGQMKTMQLGAKYVSEQYPRRSIEYWPKSKMIDWIAVLKRTPERDLGMMCYSRDLHGVTSTTSIAFNPTLFASPGRRQPILANYADGCLMYSREDHAMPFDPNASEPARYGAFPPAASTAPTPAPRDALDPGQPPDAKAPDDDFVMKCDAYMASKYPGLAAMHSQYAAANSPAPPAAPPMPPMPPAPGAPPVAPMQAQAAPPIPPPPTPGLTMPPAVPIGPTQTLDKKAPYMKTEEQIRFSKLERELQQAKTEIKHLKDSRDAERYAKNEAECGRIIDFLESGEGGSYVIDRAREISAMIGMDDAGRAAHVERVKQYSKQDFDRVVPTGGMFNTGPAGSNAPVSYEKNRELQLAAQTNGTSYSEELAKFRAGRN